MTSRISLCDSESHFKNVFYPEILTVLVLITPDSIFPSGLEVSMRYSLN